MEPSAVESGVGAFDLVGEWNVLYGLIGFPRAETSGIECSGSWVQ